MKLDTSVVENFKSLGEFIRAAVNTGDIQQLTEHGPTLVVRILSMQNDEDIREELSKLLDLPSCLSHKGADSEKVEKVEVALRKFRNISVSVKAGTEMKETHWSL